MRLPLLLPLLLLSACATLYLPQLRTPRHSFEAMREAWREDSSALFLHTLSRAVLRDYNEQAIRIGWSSIRGRVGEFVEEARVVETADYTAAPVDPRAPQGWVWPEQGLVLMRLRVELHGQHEDFLFAREVDPPPPQARQAQGFQIGDRYFRVNEHPSPETYLFEDSPESERTHWRLVFPYYPFQSMGPLTRRLQEQLAE
jgi:hypothetical protein